jgi:hypothetical protein
VGMVGLVLAAIWKPYPCNFLKTNNGCQKLILSKSSFIDRSFGMREIKKLRNRLFYWFYDGNGGIQIVNSDTKQK